MESDLERPAGGQDPWTDRLSEYLDGVLKAADRERLAAHLGSCAACATALAELREVVARAHALEDAPPATDLWPAIEARLTPRARVPRAGTLAREASIADVRAWWARRFDLGLPQLAAAGVLLIALSAGAVWLGLRGGSPHTEPIASGPGTAATAVAALANPRYDAAVAELEHALAEGRGKLDPRTLRVVEANLRIIDRALDEARQAVAADPGNTWLRSHLASTMQRKVELLRSAALLASAQG